MAKVPNVAGRYSDLNQAPIGQDVRRQLFGTLGMSSSGEGFDPGWMDPSAAGVSESGAAIPTEALSPEAAAKLKGYTFDWRPSGKRNEGTLIAYDPQGKQVGQYRQTDTSTGQSLRDLGGMLMSATGFLFPGVSTALLGNLGLGSLGSSAVMGGLGSALRGGDIKDVLKGAAIGGLGSLATPYIGAAAKSAGEAVGGGALGQAAQGAVSGAARSGIGALLGGRSVQDALLSGAVGGATNPAMARLVGTAGLPASLTKAITNQLVRRAVQQTVPTSSARPGAVDSRGLLALLNSGRRRP